MSINPTISIPHRILDESIKAMLAEQERKKYPPIPTAFCLYSADMSEEKRGRMTFGDTVVTLAPVTQTGSRYIVLNAAECDAKSEHTLDAGCRVGFEIEHARRLRDDLNRLLAKHDAETSEKA